MLFFAKRVDYVALGIFCGGVLFLSLIIAFLIPLIRRWLGLKTRNAILRWRQAAHQLGLQIEKRGESIFRPMSGTYQGRQVKVAIGHRRNSESGYNYTYCETELNPQLRLLLKLDSNPGVANQLVDAMTGTRDNTIGDTEFDRRFRLLCDDDRVRQFLMQNLDDKQNLAQNLVSAGQYVEEIILKDELVYVEEKQAVLEFQGLKQMLEWTVYLAQRVEKSNQLLPLSDWERSLVQAWKSFAEKSSIFFDEKNLSLKGPYRGFEIQATLGRSERRTWLTEFKLDFGRNLMLGLHILQQNAIHEIVSLFGAQDLQIGEAAFDKTFVVKAKNVQAVQYLLKPDLCRQLLKLNSPAKTFKVDDEGIFLSAETLVCEECLLRNYCDEIALAAQLILR